MTVHWSPGETLPARPAAVAVVLGALTLACAASFAAPLAKADRPGSHQRPGAHSIMPATYRWSVETFGALKHPGGPVHPP